jgi:hypothetical protein
MSRINSRINRIIKKTHTYISGFELRLIRDAAKARLEEETAAPSQYKNEVEKLIALWREYLNDRSNEKLELWNDEASNCSPAGVYAFIYQIQSETCENFPSGLWMENEAVISRKFPEAIVDAKEYFKRRMR